VAGAAAVDSAATSGANGSAAGTGDDSSAHLEAAAKPNAVAQHHDALGHFSGTDDNTGAKYYYYGCPGVISFVQHAGAVRAGQAAGRPCQFSRAAALAARHSGCGLAQRRDR
jgi:hypothetical protein